VHVLRRLSRKQLLCGAGAVALGTPLLVHSRAAANQPLTFTSGGATLGFHIVGEGAPIVFLAGGPGFSAHYLDTIPPYLYGVSGIMLDQRGTGASKTPSPQAPITLAQLAADIEALRTTLGFDAITLFGHSFGGFVAMTYAQLYPSRVRGLLLIDSAPPDLALEQKLDQLRIARLAPAGRTALVALHAQSGNDPGENIREQTRLMLPTLFSDPRNAAQFEPFIDSADDYAPAVAAALAPDLAAHSQAASLRDLHAPTLALFGADDPGAALVLQAMREEFTAPQTALVAGAGHFPWLEQPKNFYNTVLNFLSATGLGGSTP
jgi:pimeloyl-ACP methyl ester carboxylesterase